MLGDNGEANKSTHNYDTTHKQPLIYNYEDAILLLQGSSRKQTCRREAIGENDVMI